MHPPLLSTITLFAELFIFVAISYIFYKGYEGRIFPFGLAYFAIIYEILFNVGYMIYRSVGLKAAGNLSSELKLLGAVHGVLSLFVFIAVVVFIALAIKNYKQGINYFKAYSSLAFLLLAFWIISLSSGILLYIKAYLK
jgi:hypothetical protein